MADHSEYEENAEQFRQWLSDVIEKLKGSVGATSESTESKLQTLQDIDNDVKYGQQKLEELNVQAASIIITTSPLGAENIKAKQEELRNALMQLKLMIEEEVDSLMKAYESESACQELTNHIENEIQEFKKVIYNLESDLGTEEKAKNEDQLIALWKKRVAARSALVEEETREETLKLLLRELFRFSHDFQDLSDSVMAVIREYLSLKNKAFKLCTETESELRQSFQNPLREFHHWKSAAQRVLDATADMTDLSMIQVFSIQIETLVDESSRLKDRLMMVQLNKDFLRSIFGDQKAESLLNKVLNAAKEREALQNSLLQRILSFQTSASQSEDFDATFETLQNSLHTIGRSVAAERELQPDLVAKETRLQRLQTLHEELMKLTPQFEELETTYQHNPVHKFKINQLATEHLSVYRSLEIMFKKGRQYVSDHRKLNLILLDLQRWMMETRQELESCQDVNQEQNLDNQEHHTERLFAEFPEKEMQLHEVEAQGHRVMESTSPDGASHVQTELEQLKTSWKYLLQLLKDLAQLHTKNQFSEIWMDAGKEMIVAGGKRMHRLRSYSADDVTLLERMLAVQNEQGLKVTSSCDEMDTSESENNSGLRQSTSLPGSGRTSPERMESAEGMHQDNAITSSLEDKHTAPGRKVSVKEQKWASGFPSDAEAAGRKMGKSRSPHTQDFNSSSIEDATDLVEDMNADRGEWTFRKHTQFTDNSTPGMKMPGAAHQWTIKIHSEAEASGNKMASGENRQLTGSKFTPDNEMSPSRKRMSSSGSGGTIGLPSTEEPGTDRSTDGQNWTIEEHSNGGAYGDETAAAGQKRTIDITPNVKAFGSKMPAGRTKQRSALSTSTVDGQNVSTAGPAWTIGLPSEAPGTDMFSAGHKWTIESQLEPEAFGEEMSETGHESAIGLPFKHDTSGKNIFTAGHKWMDGLPSDNEASGEKMSVHKSTIQLTPEDIANRKKMASTEYKYTEGSLSEAEENGNKFTEGESQQRTGLNTSNMDKMTTSGKKISASAHKLGTGLPSEAEVSDGKIPAVGQKWGFGLPSVAEVSDSKMAASGHKWSIGLPSEAEVSDGKMAAPGHKWSIGLPSEASDGKMAASGHKWSIGLPSEAEVSDGKMAASGHKWSTGLPSEADISDGNMAASGHKWGIGLPSEADISDGNTAASGHKWGIRLPTEADVSVGKIPAAGHKWTIGAYSGADTFEGKMAAAGHTPTIGSHSEDDASRGVMSGEENQQSTGLRFSSVHEITGKDMDAEGNELTIRLPDHINNKVTAHGKDTEAAGSGQTPGLYFFPEDEMTALVERMGKAGRKQAGSFVHVEGNNLPAGMTSVVGGKHVSGKSSYAGDRLTAPGGNMFEEQSEWTGKLPSRSAKGMAEFSGQIEGEEKMRFPEITDRGEYSRLLKEFEEWLRVENTKLNKIRLITTSSSEEEIDMRRRKLLMLKSRIPEGQRLFETLRHYRPALGVTEDLQMEDLRYRWMLYKSKLKDSENISSLEALEEPLRLQKKPPGMCAFLRRVCCAALPLQLLLLLLLLLAFLIPLAEENHSCALANNFARSFNLMLRYDKPPPT